MKKKALIAAGGTGGHIFPALNVGKFLREKGFEVIFIGRKNSLEEKIYKQEDFKMKYIDISGLKGKTIKEKFKTLLKVIKSIIQSLKIIRGERPNVVIGFGGYISFPVIFSAKIFRIKSVICEQNAVMGFSNRISSIFSDKIFTNFTNTYKIKCKRKIMNIGNFIKQEILSLKDARNEKNTILIFGGSQGAKKINSIFMKIVKNLKDLNLKIVHITGEKNFEEIKNYYEMHNIDFVKVIPFSTKMEDFYKTTKFVISRAGATSITEFYALNLKAILIPYPYAADNHQWFNAAEYIRTGKGVILDEKYLTEEKLMKWIKFFLKNEQRFKGEDGILGDPFKSYEKLYEWVINV